MSDSTILTRGWRRGLTLTALAAVGALLVGCSSVVVDDAPVGESDESFVFTYVTGATPGVASADISDWFLDRVEEVTEGRITFERTAVESICKAAEVAECVRDGRAEIGSAVPDYTPQYFPSTSMVSIPFLTQNSQAAMQTMFDMHRDFAPARAIMERNNFYHVATWPVGRMLLGTMAPTEGVDDLVGLQARASGPIIQEVLSDAGVNLVAITATETYESVERGLINSVGAGIDFPVKFKLTELLPYWTDPGIGQYSVYSMWFSLDAYGSLPADLQAKFDQVAEEMNAGAAMEVMAASHESQCTKLRSEIKQENLTVWSDDEVAEWEDQLGDSAEQSWIALAGDQGLDDSAAFLAKYKEGLVANAGQPYVDVTADCLR